MLSFWVLCVCVCVCLCVCVCVCVCVCLFIPFLSVLFVFHGRNLVLLNLWLSNFWKQKTLWNSVKINFKIIDLFIQHNTGSSYEHMTGGVNISLYSCVQGLIQDGRRYDCIKLPEHQKHQKLLQTDRSFAFCF